MTTVTRQDRYGDLFAFALILIGIGLFLDGGRRLQEIRQLTYRHPGPRGVSQVARFDEAFFEGTSGIVVVLAGATFGIRGALAVHRRRRAVS